MNYNFDQLKETVEPGVFTPWQEVDVEIYTYTDLGISVVINNEYKGLVYKDQIYEDYKEGATLKAYIKGVRDDGRIDVSFQPAQGKYVFSTADKILEYIKAAGGKTKFNDKSSPENIKNEFQISKTVFKQAIGKLYKQGKITITAQGIELVT
ncbi:type I-B CRISPR-associated protein Cas8b1/Cst1 [Candidatus Marinamargulisbacteria bacterium SCGC AAA071-K20]|nr:type I-B CRISPR-associated protein Cas8b1/Cst1 [Candidatus Marinamargulisbacteria bacterium SCGC AAA071-K20]